LAAVFAAHGGYGAPTDFIDGFKPAITVAAAVPILGALFAVLAPSRAQERLALAELTPAKSRS
jgi:hypothetical protein